MDKKKAVISLGHDALGYTTSAQWDAVRHSVIALADMVESGYQLTITHSNGPQVGMIHKAMTELRRVSPDYTPVPMCVCSAMSQGYVGFDLQTALRSQLLSRGIATPVATILTQVTVDPYDEAFYDPKKIIGRVLTREEAEEEIHKGNYITEVPGGGYRRVIAAPRPLDIVEIDTIRTLVEAGHIVIACGGGGIPVILQQHNLKGASAVIEKDSIAGKLSIDLKADLLMILTGVEKVYLNYETDQQEGIPSMRCEQALKYISEGHFKEGTMLPKIEAAVSYLENVPDGRVMITSIDHALDAFKGKTGTVITR